MTVQSQIDAAYAEVKWAAEDFMQLGSDEAFFHARACMDVEVLLEESGAKWPTESRPNPEDEVRQPLENLRRAALHLQGIEPGDRPDTLGAAWAELNALIVRATP